jgi:hypothetical protein
LAGRHVSAAQGHYISNLIRQKLIVGIDKVVPEPDLHAKKYLFFLPGNELHELGLLYTHYLTKARGHACVYLGQSVPFDDLVTISEKVEPDYLVTIFTAAITDMHTTSFLKRCSEKIPNACFLISGRKVLHAEEKLVVPEKKFVIFEDFERFKKLI